MCILNFAGFQVGVLKMCCFIVTPIILIKEIITLYTRQLFLNGFSDELGAFG